MTRTIEIRKCLDCLRGHQWLIEAHDHEDMKSTDLGEGGRVRFFERGPDSWLDALPAGQLATLELVFESELLHDVFLGGFVRVQVQTVKNLQRFLSVSVRRVCHPATRLHLQDDKISSTQFPHQHQRQYVVIVFYRQA